MTRYVAVLAARSRAPLAPVAAILLVLLGVYAYKPNEVGSTWAFTALLTFPLCAWLTVAVLRGEPGAQRDIVTAALGGRRGLLALRARLGAFVTLAVTAAMLGFPMTIGAFDRTPGLGDVVAGAIAHLDCAALGAALGIACAPPALARAADAAAVITGASLAAVAITAVLPDAAAGPAGLAGILVDARPDTVPAALLGATGSCLVLAAAGGLAAAAWARYRA